MSNNKLLKGGISVGLPDQQAPGDLAQDGHSFSLSQSYKQALEERFYDFDYYLIEFEHISINDPRSPSKRLMMSAACLTPDSGVLWKNSTVKGLAAVFCCDHRLFNGIHAADRATVGIVTTVEVSGPHTLQPSDFFRLTLNLIVKTITIHQIRVIQT